MTIDRDAADAAHERHHDWSKALAGHAAESGENAIKAGAFINSGAAIAMLTLLSTSSPALQNLNKVEISTSFLLYIIGVFLSAVGSGLAYLINSFYAGAEGSKTLTYEWPYVHANGWSKFKWWSGWILNWVALFVVAGSYVRGWRVE